MIELDWTVLAAAPVFLLTLWALNRLLFQPLFRVLDERQSKTTGLLDRAGDLRQKYEQRLQDYEQRIRREKRNSYQRAESVRQEALQLRQQRITDAKVSAQGLLEEVRERLRGELTGAKENLERDIHEIVRTISSRVLERG